MTHRPDTAPAPRLNGALIKSRRRALNLSREDTARAANLALTALTRIEDGHATAGVTIGQLTRLAGALAVDPATLIGTGEPPPPAQDPNADVARLACLLLVAGGTISRDAAARTLGWTLPRTVATLDALEHQAPPLGVRLHRHGYSIRLIRDNHRTGSKLATLLRRDQVTRSTKARTARLAHALLTGDPDAATATATVLAEARAAGITTDGPHGSELASSSARALLDRNHRPQRVGSPLDGNQRT